MYSILPGQISFPAVLPPMTTYPYAPSYGRCGGCCCGCCCRRQCPPVHGATGTNPSVPTMTTYHKRPTIGPVGDDDEDFQLPHTTVVPLTFSTTPETTYSATIEFVSDGEPEA